MPKRATSDAEAKAAKLANDEPAKRNKPDPEEHGAGAAATAAASACLPCTAGGVTASTAPPSVEEQIPTEDSLPHLCCSVCLGFPDSEVLQCCAGHILCRVCYNRVCHEEQPKCPTCREPLDLLKPIQNKIAEESIARLRVSCPNDGCSVSLTRGSLSQHLASECAFRTLSCKYGPLGCKWSGFASALPKHEDRCKRAEQPGWKLLKRVEAMQDAAKKKQAAELAERESNYAVVQMLEDRCRNIEFTSVQLHKCSAHEHIGGNPAHLVSAAFHALGFRWKLYTLSELGASRYSVVLQLRDCRVPLPADFFVLRGQPLELPTKPAVCSHTFALRHRASSAALIADGPAADALSDMETLTLRIGLIDKRSGRPDRGFLGQMHSGYGDDEWEDDEVGSQHGDLGLDDSDGDYSDDSMEGAGSRYPY